MEVPWHTSFVLAKGRHFVEGARFVMMVTRLGSRVCDGIVWGGRGIQEGRGGRSFILNLLYLSLKRQETRLFDINILRR